MESFWRALVSALRRKGGFWVSIVSLIVSALKQTAGKKMGRSVSTPTRRVVALSARDQKPKATPGLFANAALPLESALMLLPSGALFTSTEL